MRISMKIIVREVSTAGLSDNQYAARLTLIISSSFPFNNALLTPSPIFLIFRSSWRR